MPSEGVASVRVAHDLVVYKLIMYHWFVVDVKAVLACSFSATLQYPVGGAYG